MKKLSSFLVITLALFLLFVTNFSEKGERVGDFKPVPARSQLPSLPPEASWPAAEVSAQHFQNSDDSYLVEKISEEEFLESYANIDFPSDALTRPSAKPQLKAVNRAQNFKTVFSEEGVFLKTLRGDRDWTMDVKLTGYGWNGALASVGPGELRSEEERVEIVRGDLTEWFINSFSGLEQGFTLDSPPEGNGEALVFDMSCDSTYNFEVADDGLGINFSNDEGHVLFSYAGLKVNDATGKEIPSHFEVKPEGWEIVVDASEDIVYPLIVDPYFLENQVINTGGPVAISEDLLVTSSAIYRRVSGIWTLEHWLPYSVLDVAISKDLVAVAGPAQVIILSMQGDTWVEEATLTPFSSVSSIAISGSTLVAGYAYDGLAMVFRRLAPGQWIIETVLVLSDPFAHSDYVDVEGDLIVIGSRFTGAQGQKIHIFHRHDGSNWIEEAQINHDASYFFGASPFSFSGNKLAIIESSGEGDFLKIYQRIGNGTWVLEDTIANAPFHDVPTGYLGVSLAGNIIAVTSCSGGIGFVFSKSSNNNWAFSGTLLSSAINFEDIAVSGGTCILSGFPHTSIFDLIITPHGVEQQPVVNSPAVCNVYGLANGGCGGCSQLQDVSIATNQLSGGQNIIPHSGQELRDETDLTIKGRDGRVDFEIMRRHLTGINQENSPFGPAWGFNYTHTFRVPLGENLVMTSFGRQDEFVQVSSHTWEGGHGRFDRLSYDGNALSKLRLTDGRILEFHTETNAMPELVGHLTAIASPNGNRLTFTYETSSQEPDLLKRKLLTVTESFGRDIQFFYEDSNYPDGLSRIRDFSGREVIYDYNSSGQLLSVRTPAIISTNGLNDFPSGKLTQYTYLNHSDEKMRHALTSIEFPNQSTTPGTQARLSWTYETDPDSTQFGFVKTHHVGNTALGSLSAGGVYDYSYFVLPENSSVNEPAIFTYVTDRKGTQTQFTLNQTGQVLEQKIRTRGLRVGEPPEYDTNYVYNDDGDLLQSIAPLTTTSNRTHVPMSHPRNSEANETQKQNPVDPRGGDQTSITTEVIYDPIFNKPFKTTDARGHTTTHIIDYMEDLAQAKSKFAPLLGISENALQQLFDAAGIVDVPDVNGDGITFQPCGNVIQIIYPDVSLPPEASQLGLGSTQQAEEIFRFNEFGQEIYHKDAEENVTIKEYFGANDPDGDGVIDVPGASSLAGGYLKRVIQDNESGAGRNSGQNPPPVRKTTEYRYTSQGAFPANPRGVPTAVIDPRGIQHRYLINELDQTVKEVRASDVSTSPETGLTSFGYEKVTLFDANNNVIEERIQNKDTLDGANDFIVHQYSFDILDQKTQEVFDVGGPSEITNTYTYDANQNLVEKTRGVGSPEVATEAWTYDERDIVITHTRGVGTADQSTRSTEIDDNGNIVKWIDAAGGDEDQIIFDGFDRQKELIDRAGNRRVFTYDPESQVVREDRYGRATLGGPEVKLASTHTHFDERDRPDRKDQELYFYSGQAVGRLDDGSLNPGDGLVSAVTLYDRLGRAVGTVDADNDLFERRFDGLGRVLKTLDPLGNEVDFVYDPNDNLQEMMESETSPLLASAEVFRTRTFYDALNRRQSVEEPNGQTTLYQYDSRDNLIKTTDQLGNEVDKRYDRLNRLVDTRTYLSSDGQDASSSNRDFAQGGGDGMIQILQSWDDLNRLTGQTDDAGQVTAYSYDTLDRQVRLDYQDGTFELFTYNADSELLSRTHQNGSIETWQHDPKGRPTGVVINNAGTNSIGTTEKTWAYDGLDRVIEMFDNNGSGDDVTCSYLYDSLSRKIREVQAIGSLPSRQVDCEWQGQSRKVSCEYPNGRKVKRSYDALDRLFEIREDRDNSLIARFEYVGPSRTARVTYGNRAVLDKRNLAGTSTISGADAGYDANRRSIRHTWESDSGNPITSYLSTYNGPSGIGTNRRLTEEREHLFNHLDTYSYDSAYRQLSFDRNGLVLSTRDLDGVDNMTSFTDEGFPKNPVQNGTGMNQYSSFGNQSYLYDDNGNLIDDGEKLYFYDYSDRLVRIQSKATSNTLVTYLYDANNRRVQKIFPAGTDLTDEVTSLPVALGLSQPNQTLPPRTRRPERIRYLYCDWQVLEERGTDGNVLRQYVDGRSIDEHLQFKDYTQSGNPVYYYHCNDQGFVGALSNNSGDVVEYYEYSWLGRPKILAPNKTSVLPNSIVGNSYMFQGRRYDQESELHYYRNRYYSHRLGRFFQFDPYGTSGVEDCEYAIYASAVNPAVSANDVMAGLGIWHDEMNRGNGYGAFGGDGWNNSDEIGLATKYCSLTGSPYCTKSDYKNNKVKKVFCHLSCNYFEFSFCDLHPSGITSTATSEGHKLCTTKYVCRYNNYQQKYIWAKYTPFLHTSCLSCQKGKVIH